MANPNEIEDKDQVTPESKDALQEEREKEEKKRIKDHEEDLVNKSAKGEVVISNPFVESWIRGFNKIKEFFDTLFNPDGKGDVATNQGTRAGGRFQKSTVDVEDLKDIFENTHFEYDDSFIQKVKNVKPSYDILASRASRGDREAYQSLLKQLGDKEAADRLVEKYRDNNNEQPQKSTDFEK